MRIFIASLSIIILSCQMAFGQSNTDCYDCHNDPEFTMEKRGKTLSLHVDPAAFQKAKHGKLKCIDCHVNFDPEEEPHSENLTPAGCASCHKKDGNSLARGGHGGELACTDCHTGAHQPEKSSTAMRQSCNDCHDDAVADFRGSVHFAAEKPLACLSCHDRHGVTATGSKNCLTCHGEREFVHDNIANEDLASVLKYEDSIHQDAAACSDCHGAHGIVAAASDASPVNRRNVMTVCNDCHEDVVAEYKTSEHYQAMSFAFDNAPTCTDCHGEHDIQQISDDRSYVSREHEVAVCMHCHYDSPDVKSRMSHDAGFIAGYDKSVHGRAFKAGNTSAAICSDCHGAHTGMRASNKNSLVNKFNISNTCGNCHGEIAAQFDNSVHGTSLANGVEDSPTCTDCHGEHEIIEHQLSSSPVAPQNVSQEVCGPCHNSVKLASKFGLPSRNYDSYLDSYHGLAVRFGSVQVANCASCHGVHNILPSSDPNSLINSKNLAVTCGKCHPGANDNVTVGKVHVTAEADSNLVLFWITRIYILLIVGTIGAMFLHNLLDWYKKVRKNYRRKHIPNYEPNGPEHEAKKAIHYVRMTLNERIQHALLASSFILLVITGFMLKFPDAWWVLQTRMLTGESLFAMRGLLHRFAAVVMVAVSLYHIYYVIFTHRGRQLIRDLMFRFQDLKDMVLMLKYNLGISRQKPRFDRFNYIEKSEYWALIWGTVVMTVTGFALWFENQTMAYFSKIFVDVCELIHYYEAWLAFLAIVVWHFYYVIFNPDVYPINLTWLTGKVTEVEMEEEYPLELERIRRERQAAVKAGEPNEAEAAEHKQD